MQKSTLAYPRLSGGALRPLQASARRPSTNGTAGTRAYCARTSLALRVASRFCPMHDGLVDLQPAALGRSQSRFVQMDFLIRGCRGRIAIAAQSTSTFSFLPLRHVDLSEEVESPGSGPRFRNCRSRVGTPPARLSQVRSAGRKNDSDRRAQPPPWSRPRIPSVESAGRCAEPAPSE